MFQNIHLVHCCLQLFVLGLFHALHFLKEALNKAAGRKSKAPVQLDLGDMLAALEKQQQAMKARQMTNTKPLSYSGKFHCCTWVPDFLSLDYFLFMFQLKYQRIQIHQSNCTEGNIEAILKMLRRCGSICRDASG